MRFFTKNLLVFSILSGITSFSCPAQDISTQYQVFTVNEGLPQNYLLGLAQDSAGFIWAGTKDGLARYDGYGFTIYRHGKDSLHTPAANNVSNLYNDHRGYLWIQYDSRALDRYDPSTGIFDHISGQRAWDPIRSLSGKYELLVDRHDNVWVLTENKGLYRYNIPSRKLSPFSQLPSIIPRGIMEDHSGRIWIATQEGFSVYDYSRDQVKNIPYLLSARQTYSGRNYKFGIGELGNGNVVVSSLDSTILIYDPVHNLFQATTARGRRHNPYDAGLGNTNPVRAANGDRWLTCNGRILRIDKLTGEIHEMDDPTLPQSPDASALLIDRSGNLWYGKNAQGLCKINLNAPRFVSKKYAYANFETDILVNELGVGVRELPADFNNPAFGYMFRNAIDKANNLIWIQNYLMGRYVPKLLSYDMGTKKIMTKNILNSKNGEVGVNSDDAGNIWVV